MARYKNSERGMALMIVLLVMMLLSALMIGFMTSIMADQRSSGIDRDETQTYAAAHAGMEKLTSELAAVFRSDYSPNGKQISDVAGTPPSITGFKYLDPADPWSTTASTGYKVQFTVLTGAAPGTPTLVTTPQVATVIPAPDDPTTGTTIAAGPYQGFKGLVTHYNIIVTARSSGGSEVRMRRELQTVAVPVFQFGVFSEGSLSFHSSSDFNFGGRVHTNGNLFLAGGNGSPARQLWLSDKVTAVGEVVRRYLDNGLSSLTDYPGSVNVAKGAGKYKILSATTNAAKASNVGEGSVKDAWVTGTDWSTPATTGKQNEPTWTTVSIGDTNGYLRNGRTGARRLDLPLVSDGAQPIDLIRRPVSGENTAAPPSRGPFIYPQRYYKQASLRILLSDKKEDITGLPEIDTTKDPVSLEAGSFGPLLKTAPIALSGSGGDYKSTAGTSLIGGFIKIEMQKQSDGTWADVTDDILALGIAGRNLSNGTANTVFTGANGSGSATKKSVLNGCLGTDVHPNAIIRLERVKDVPSTDSDSTMKYDCAISGVTGAPSATATDYWPLALYDAREGFLRGDGNTAKTLRLGGVMYYVELDVNNLGLWFKGTIGTKGSQAKNDNNGYIVYFSDRRNNRNDAGNETGEYGNEDSINPTTSDGSATGTLDLPEEDVNAPTPVPVGYVPVKDIYGAKPTDGKGGASGTAPAGATNPLDSTARVTTVWSVSSTSGVNVVRGNRPIFFRRALKLVNGSNVSTNITGLTIASENPVYVQGNYNVNSSTDASTGTHAACSIIADAVTLLSNGWNDIKSFWDDPVKASNKDASDTAYRFAAVTGKNISFSQVGLGWTPADGNFGMDGGAHNLLRQLEDWSGNTLTYRGSIVSFYISRQATGIFKYEGGDIYVAPGTRNFTFDDDFLIPSKLPPGTPMFRDVNTLTFRQLLRPNQ